jgi:hypothetical protein
MARRQFQYWITSYVPSDELVGNYQALFNDRGMSGWELVAVVPRGEHQSPQLIFKKEIDRP